MKWVVYLLGLMLVIGAAQAATIHGSVYDFYLDEVENGKAVITTEPKQQQVLADSSYSFEVEAGEYDLFVYKLENGEITMAAKETLIVSKDGTYNVDVILFPYFEEQNIIQESQDLFQERNELNLNLWPIWLLFVGSLVVLTGLMFLAFVKLKKLKPVVMPREEKLGGELEKIVDYLKKEGGRATQKDIRKEFPLSEGKISLMISELEEKEIVKRIKKGRGNIIVLNEPKKEN